MLLYTILQLLLISSLSKISLIHSQWINSHYNCGNLATYGIIISNVCSIFGQIIGNYLHKSYNLSSIIKYVFLLYPCALYGFLVANPKAYLVSKIIHGICAGILSYGSIAMIITKPIGWVYRSVLLSVIPSLVPLILIYCKLPILMLLLSIISVFGFFFSDLLIVKDKFVKYSYKIGLFDILMAIVNGINFAHYIRMIQSITKIIKSIYSIEIAYLIMAFLFIAIGLCTLLQSYLMIPIFLLVLPSMFLDSRFRLLSKIIIFVLSSTCIICILNKSIRKADNKFMFMSVRMLITSFFLLNPAYLDVYLRNLRYARYIRIPLLR